MWGCWGAFKQLTDAVDNSNIQIAQLQHKIQALQGAGEQCSWKTTINKVVGSQHVREREAKGGARGQPSSASTRWRPTPTTHIFSSDVAEERAAANVIRVVTIDHVKNFSRVKGFFYFTCQLCASLMSERLPRRRKSGRTWTTGAARRFLGRRSQGKRAGAVPRDPVALCTSRAAQRVATDNSELEGDGTQTRQEDQWSYRRGNREGGLVTSTRCGLGPIPAFKKNEDVRFVTKWKLGARGADEL